MVRTAPAARTIVVAGDGWSVPAMERRGLLKDVPPFRYAQDLSAADWSTGVDTVGRMVVTDTNRRRDSIPNRLTNGQGPLLAAEDRLPQTSRTLGADPADQTVLEVLGGRARATQSGFAFFDLPYAAPDNAFDNDPQTAWIFGDFKTGAGQRLVLSLDAPQSIGSVSIRQADRGQVRISSITVSAGDTKQKASFGSDGVATVDLGGVLASEVTFGVGRLVGDGFNAVAIQDVTIPGVDLTRVARTPTTLDRQYRDMAARSRAQFRQTPLDILLTRAQGTPAPGDDEEVSLERDLSIPNDRRFDARAVVRIDADREDLFDRVARIPAGATSSSRIFDNPDVRASQAFDGSSRTAWIPGGDSPAGAWIQLAGPSRELPAVTIDQRKIPGAAETAWASRVTVTADGKVLASADVEPGANSIDLRSEEGIAPTVQTVRITIDETANASGPATSPPRIVEIGAGRALTVDKDASRCVEVARVDGRPLRMRPTGSASRDGTAWRKCGSPLTLGAGSHRVRSVDPGVALDSLDLLDRLGAAPPTEQAAPDVTAEWGFGASLTATAQANLAGNRYLLSIGQAFDPRWRAAVDGEDLGDPIVVDGYGTGWLITATKAVEATITFGPQRAMNLAIAVSGIGLVTIGLIWVGVVARSRMRWADRVAAAWSRRRRRVVEVMASFPDAVSRRFGEPLPRPTRPRIPARARMVLGWLALLGGAGVFASWPGLVAVVLLGLWQVVRPPTGKLLIHVGAALVLLAGLVFVAGMGEDRGVVTADLVTGNPWPNLITVCGLVFAVVGVWRSGPPAPTERMSSRE